MVKTMDHNLEKMLQELHDRQEIYDCMVRYCRGMDRLDRECVSSCYHEDAIDDHGNFVGPYKAFIDWAFDYHQTCQVHTQHSISNHLCEIEGNTAHCETYYTFWGRNKSEPEYMSCVGRYIDRLEKRNGRWAIVQRICTVDFMDGKVDPQTAGADNFYPISRDQNDPSYMRPLNVDKDRFTT